MDLETLEDVAARIGYDGQIYKHEKTDPLDFEYFAFHLVRDYADRVHIK
jgi:hypothetical protein